MLFLHQSESKEIDEMKRIAVVVMRKDRELKNLKKIIYIHSSPDRQQSKRNGPYDLITSFSETRILNIIHHACFRYSNFLQDKMLTG